MNFGNDSQDRELVKQILKAYDNGQIAWQNVPLLTELIQKQVSQQSQAAIEANTQALADKYHKALNKYASGINADTNDLLNAQQEEIQRLQREVTRSRSEIKAFSGKLEESKLRRTLILLSQWFAILIMVISIIAVAVIAIPAILNGLGIAALFHGLKLSWTFWGAIKAVFGVIITATGVGFAAFLISYPAALLIKVWEKINGQALP